jgi:hypothetical protein
MNQALYAHMNNKRKKNKKKILIFKSLLVAGVVIVFWTLAKAKAPGQRGGH